MYVCFFLRAVYVHRVLAELVCMYVHVYNISDYAVRTSSMSTFDSIELGRFSDDSARDNDDRVAGIHHTLCVLCA